MTPSTINAIARTHRMIVITIAFARIPGTENERAHDRAPDGRLFLRRRALPRRGRLRRGLLPLLDLPAHLGRTGSMLVQCARRALPGHPRRALGTPLI